jgi:uncharacterized protein (TIGR02996 family)
MQELLRDAALEAAVIEAPLDPVPRMVYADWLQAAGDRRGEWMALSSAIENDPKNVRLRSLAVEFLGDHTELLLGGGKSLLTGAWIGWRGGFIDEVRVQGYDKAKGIVEAFAALLAHPSCRFVRCVGIGDLGGDAQAAVDVLAEAAPPLLETVVVCDAMSVTAPVDIDTLAALPRLRRLGLFHANVARPLPRLKALSFRLGQRTGEWVASSMCPSVESLTIDCRDVESPLESLTRVLRATPVVRELRLLHLNEADAVMEAVATLRKLETVDVSHSTLTDAGAQKLRKDVRVVALRSVVSSDVATRIGAVVSRPNGRSGRMDRVEYDQEAAGGWLVHQMANGGRESVALMPGIGSALFSVGTHHSMNGQAAISTLLLDASLTLPNVNVKTWAWANAAIAHERVLELDDAELIAREGMLRAPREPNLYAIVVDALRRSDRLEQALKLLPKAFASIRAPKGPGAHTGGPPACLADCLLVLAQAGRHREVLDQAEKYADVAPLKPHIFAIVAMSQVALGKIEDARASMKKTDPDGLAGLDAHARAVMTLVAKRPKLDTAVALLRECKEARYPEWHWIAKDPNLAKLADVPEFVALLD